MKTSQSLILAVLLACHAWAAIPASDITTKSGSIADQGGPSIAPGLTILGTRPFVVPAFNAGTPIQMPAYQVVAPPDRTFEEVNAAIAVEQRLTPPSLFSRDLFKLRFQLVGSALTPLWTEASADQQQLRIPVLKLTW